MFATPAEAARQAVEADVHILGVSSLAAGHLTLVPEIKRELLRLGRPDILLVLGGIVPARDHEAVQAAGVDAIFPPGTAVTEAAAQLMDALAAAHGFAQKAPASYRGARR